MKVYINGKGYDVPQRVNTLEELVNCMKLNVGNTRLMHNGTAVPWDKWPSVTVREDDVIKILTLISGG